jgi:predicted transcriptional regulator
MNNLAKDKLTQIKASLDTGGTESSSIRTLLKWFGMSRRSYYNTRDIRAGLKKFGLVTFPDFNNGWIDQVIEYRLVAKEEPKRAEPVMAEEELIEGPTYRVSRLKASSQGVISVKPNDALAKATTIMLTEGFSQLPVMSSERDLKGIISWKSLGIRVVHDKQLIEVKDAMDAPTDCVVSGSDVMLEVIEKVVRIGYVLVTDEQKKIVGIVTTADLSEEFQNMTEPFLIVGEIENHLRQILGQLEIDWETAKNPTDELRKVNSPDDLTLGEIKRFLESEENWNLFNIQLDRVQLGKLLERVVTIRNDIMHFNYDTLPSDDVEHLRKVANLFRQLKSSNIT